MEDLLEMLIEHIQQTVSKSHKKKQLVTNTNGTRNRFPSAFLRR